MALVELDVDWLDAPADGAALSRAVYVRCRRQPDESNKKTFLRLELLQGRCLWRTDVYEKQKPAVLDCTVDEYLDVLERCFTIGAATSKEKCFSYKWSSGKSTLTLMEQAGSGFAMKYTALGFMAVDGEQLQTQQWQGILHDIVVKSKHSYGETSRQRLRIQELETMLTAKDKLLESALAAKQRLEDELFTKFCAVLNAKKEEIERLQHELMVAQARADDATSSHEKKSPGKRPVAPGGRKKAVGAKLTRGTKTKKPANSSDDEEERGNHGKEEEEESDQSDHEAEEDEDEDDDDDAGRSRRVTRGAIEAYSQLATQLKTPSQVCAAADVLDDLDAIMKTETEQDDQQTQTRHAKFIRKRQAAPSVAPSPGKKFKASPAAPPPRTQAPRTATKSKTKPATPPPPKAIDSEEEDILDMLS